MRWRRRVLTHASAYAIMAGFAFQKANLIPFLIYADASQQGTLRAHLARGNPQWHELAVVEQCLVVFQGAQEYVTPSWYPTKQETGKVVPTWNYVVAHAHGRLIIHDDLAWLEANVRQLSTKHEAERAEPWSVDDAPAAYVAGQLRAIVGVELLIDRLEAKVKLSQNRSTDDIGGVIDGLEADDERSVSAAMRARRGG